MIKNSDQVLTSFTSVSISILMGRRGGGGLAPITETTISPYHYLIVMHNYSMQNYSYSTLDRISSTLTFSYIHLTWAITYQLYSLSKQPWSSGDILSLVSVTWTCAPHTQVHSPGLRITLDIQNPCISTLRLICSMVLDKENTNVERGGGGR